jgi:CSLREA domain-containing protein
MNDGHRGRTLGVGIGLILVMLLFGAADSHAATFTVNTTDDVSDGTCDVTHCSLREAIVAANALGGIDTIAFDIAPASVVHTIVLASPLPAIEGRVILDGYSQSGAAANTNAIGALNGTVLIELVPGFPIVPGQEDQHVGLTLDSAYATIRGLSINGFRRDLRLDVPLDALLDITIVGNYLGVKPDGSVPATHSDRGIEILEKTSNLVIGGALPGDRNLISAHTDAGIWITRLEDGATGVKISGNLIGTGPDGETARGNSVGIRVNGPAAPQYGDLLVIGGATIPEGNVISGNGTGIEVSRPSGYDIGDLEIRNNAIGISVSGAPLGNTGAGILFQGEATASVAENFISNNAGGIVILSAGTKVTMSGNQMLDNTTPGIDLGGDGPTPNDPHDLDDGANGLQNAPVLRYAASAGGGWEVVGTLRANASETFTIELFNNHALGRSGYDALEAVGQTSVTTDADGVATFTTAISSTFSIGDHVTATATDSQGRTSELSATVDIIPDGAGISGVITETQGSTPLANVTVTLTGPSSETTMTDASGAYTFLYLQPGSYTVTPSANGYTFTPPDQTIGMTTSDEVQDFAADAVSATFTVNSTAEPGDGVCDVIECTFREALNAADAHFGPDTIAFNIPGTGVQTITWDSDAPEITEALTIDGFTQPGSSPNTNATGGLNAVPLIYLFAGPLAQSSYGLAIGADHVTIRGLAIDGFYDGVLVGCGCGYKLDDVTVAGNYIGTTPGGTLSPLTSSSSGVTVLADVTNTTVGGPLPADRNLLSGNYDAGIYSQFYGYDTRQITIIGNLIGTDATGQSALANGMGIWHTVFPIAGDSVHIGGATAAEQNVISGNVLFGVLWDTQDDDTDDTDNVIRGNLIGLAADGTTALGNVHGAGVFAPTSGTKLTIQDNVIAHNGGAGVDQQSRTSANAYGVTMHRNSIYENDGLGIDLNGDGRTANDPTDGDTGPNRRQNFPVITSVQEQLNHHVVITGTLQSAPNQPFEIELFTTGGTNSPGRDARTSLGESSHISDNTGLASFTTELLTLPAGEYIVATATDSHGNTSEISDATVLTPLPNYSLTGTITKDGAPLTGVQVAINGSSVATTTTNGAGQYAFPTLPGTGTYTVTPTLAAHTFTPPFTIVASLNANTSPRRPIRPIRARIRNRPSIGSTWPKAWLARSGTRRCRSSIRPAPRRRRTCATVCRAAPS